MRINRKETAARLIEQDDILILCHRNPDGDTLGSGYGLHFALKQMGKRSRVLCSDPIPAKMEYLRGTEKMCIRDSYLASDIGISRNELLNQCITFALDHVNHWKD